MLPPWWNNYLKDNFFKDHDGFYAIPYLSDSAEAMLESVLSFQNVIHKKEKKLIYTDNPFLKGSMHYCEIETGLWILGYDLEVYHNLVGIATYDSERNEDYYFLSFSLFKYLFPTNSNQTEFVLLNSSTCNFYKPNTKVASFFYEKAKGKFFNIIFSKDWATKNIKSPSNTKTNQLLDCLDGKRGFINWIDIIPDAEELTGKTWNLLEQVTVHKAPIGNLKSLINNIVENFFNNALVEKRLQNTLPLNEDDYLKIAVAEKIILCNLTFPFLGVENIARAVHISPTILKQKFRMVFGFSMLQYHKEKNMLLAKQLCQKTDLLITEIASLTGYSSLSKFTAAFRKRFLVTPSAFKKNILTSS